MVTVLMYLIAACAILGGVDRIFGNKLGLGEAFENGFKMLGPLSLSMAGMIYLAPLAAQLLSPVVTPVYRFLGQDPGMFASFLALDMGGYQMAGALAADPLVGKFAGIIVGATLGCTISFTIPTGSGILPEESKNDFAYGTMYGIITLPLAMILGAMLCGIPLLQALWLCLPLAVFAGILAFILVHWPNKAGKAFRLLAIVLKIIATSGLTIGVVQKILNIRLLPSIAPIDDALAIVMSICVMLLGSLPLAEILKKILRRPLSVIGNKLGIGAEGVMGMLITFISITPGLASLSGMSSRGRKACSAFAVCAASCLTSHTAFTLNTQPQLVTSLILVKFIGGLLGAALAILITRKDGQSSV